MNSMKRYFQCVSLAKGIHLITLTLFLGSVLFFWWVRDEFSRLAVFNIMLPVYNILATAALFLAYLNSRNLSRKSALAWGLLALAQFLYTLGDILWAILELGLKVTPFPSVADGPYLLFYLAFFLGILNFPTKPRSRMDVIKQSLDVFTVMGTATIAYWIFLIEPVLQHQGDVSLVEKALSVAYPVGDLILFFSVLVILYYQSSSIIQGPIWFVTGSLVLMVVTDSVYTYQSLLDTYQAGHLIDFGWLIAYILMALAGVYQVLSPASPGKVGGISGSILGMNEKTIKTLPYLPYVWVAAVFFLLLEINNDLVLQDGVKTLSIGIGSVIGLLIARQILTTRENNLLLKNLARSLEQLKYQAAELDHTNINLRQEIYERKQIEARLSYNATHDGITGLANRTLFTSRLEQALAQARQNEEYHFAVLFLDLDNFKAINDGLGHSAGDSILVEVAPRLRHCVRSVDTVARFGGDEFAILLENNLGYEALMSVASRLIAEIERPIEIKGIEVRVTCSIGIVEKISGFENPEAIMRDVDIAMYQAKKKGKACFEIFSIDMRQSVLTQLTIENDLRRGISSGEFVLYYQPIYSLDLNRVIALEALMRWKHPTRGLLMPAEFIDIAEKTGLIVPLGEWGLREACTQMQNWRLNDPRLEPLSLYFNVSDRQITQKQFKQKVIQTLEQTGFPPSRLKLEISENTYVENQSLLNALFAELRDEGVALVIDDFGTGYSSLAYLKHIPLTTIKIDRSFTKDIEESTTDFEIIKAIVTMAHGLRMTTIAEGIETVGQLLKYKALNCTFGQGYYLSMPLEARRVEMLLEEQTIHEV